MDFRQSIIRVLKQVHPDLTLTRDGLFLVLTQLNIIYQQFNERIVSDDDVKPIISEILRDKLAIYADKDGARILENKRELIFDLVPMLNITSRNSLLYITAVIEYLAAEILELSGNYARANKARAKRILPTHIIHAIQRDAELSLLFPNI